MRRFALVFIAVVVLLLVGVIIVSRGGSSYGPPLALPGGIQVRIAAITYGTNHVYGSPFERLVARLSAFPQGIVRQFAGQGFALPRVVNTSEPTLMIWLERQTNNPANPAVKSPTPIFGGGNPGYFATFLSDGSGFVSGKDYHYSISQPWAGTDPVSFTAFPRRDSEIALEFYHHSPQGKVSHIGRLPFKNPLVRAHPEWVPEPLPAIRENNGLVATLLSLHTGHDSHMTYKSAGDGRTIRTRGTNRVDGNNYSQVDISLVATNNPGQVWQAVGVEVSDATGNVVRNNSMSWSGDDQTFAFSPSLWPAEKAWKTTIEVKRTQGFLPEELILFEDVPLGELGETNRVAWTTNMAGVVVTLDEICRRPPMDADTWSSRDLSYVRITHSPLPEGLHLDLLPIVLDTGETNTSSSWSSDGRMRTYSYRGISPRARTANLTVAVQRGRKFEFTVKPAMP